MHADVAASRIQRWTRGDWQLLPVLLHARRFGLRTINRWKIVDNLRRSLVAPIFGGADRVEFVGSPMLPLGRADHSSVRHSARGPLLGAIAALAPSRDDVALGHFYRAALTDVCRAIGSISWNVAMLLHNALLLAGSIVTATYRTLISHRRLLQWTTTAHAQSTARHDLIGLTRRHLTTDCWSPPDCVPRCCTAVRDRRYSPSSCACCGRARLYGSG